MKERGKRGTYDVSKYVLYSVYFFAYKADKNWSKFLIRINIIFGYYIDCDFVLFRSLSWSLLIRSLTLTRMYTYEIEAESRPLTSSFAPLWSTPTFRADSGSNSRWLFPSASAHHLPTIQSISKHPFIWC